MLLRLFVCLLIFATSAGSDFAGASIALTLPSEGPKRLALVVGVSDYRFLPKIKNTAADARLIGSALNDLGFETVVVLDPTALKLKQEIERFSDRLRQSGPSISFFYYAGQGIAISGRNQMIAADSALPDSAETLSGNIPFEDVFGKVAQANQEGSNFLVFDACRNNPFAANGTRGPSDVEGGLNQMSVSADTLIAYSTSAGQLALDGAGCNGPYAQALAKALAIPDIGHAELFRKARNETISLTQGRQVPWYQDKISTEVVFNLQPAQGAIAGADDDVAKSRAAVAMVETEDGELGPTYADGSYALIIGVSDYKDFGDGVQAWADLPSVTGEARNLAKVLRDVHGFETTEIMNPTGNELEAALEEFISLHGPKPNARLLIYMAGHGTTVTTHNKKVAWFIPADAPALRPPAPFQNVALNLRRVEEWSEILEAKHVLWIFDSCFSGAALKMMQSRGGEEEEDGYDIHLKTHPVRRVLTSGSENEEVPAESFFSKKLVAVLSGTERVGNEDDVLTGRELGEFLRKATIRYAFKQGYEQTPQSDTIVIPDEEGDIVFSLEDELTQAWKLSSGTP